jgi:1-phosphofructokinase family hexose kinase
LITKELQLVEHVLDTHFEQASQIICFNVNPALERTCVVDQLVLGAVNRTDKYVVTASGKAATVARTITNLGFKALQVGPLAGKSGEDFVELLSAEGLDGEWLWIPGQTRTNVTIISKDGTADTIVNERGPSLTHDQWLVLKAMVSEVAGPAMPVCISGSIPAGVAPEDLSALVADLRAKGSAVFVDSSGWALEALLEGTPWCAKFNHHEAEVLLGRSISSVEDAAIAALELLPKVEELVIITMGSEGAVVATQENLVAHVKPPKVQAISGVGSGDTFLGALAVAIFNLEHSYFDAVMFASTAGAINATSISQGDVSVDKVDASIGAASLTILELTKNGI